MSLLPAKESLIVEFKSDADRIPDSELIAAVACFANAEGGDLFIGVEDDGTPTGLHIRHQDVIGLTALIANRTSPSISVRVERLDIGGIAVAHITVPKSESIVSTTDGLVQRRRLRADGTPECAPLYPHEFAQRQSDLRRLDYSALPVVQAVVSDFNPLERERLRLLVSRYGGDSSLIGLDDAELDGALGFVVRQGNHRVPTVAGLLTIGKESALRAHIPTHEVALQDLAGTIVRLNEFIRVPLLDVFERVYEQQFTARLIEEEMQVGLFRVPVPNYDRRAFREGFVNALVHRDYTRLGAVHVRWETDGLVLSNPGGFVEGVTLDSLLVTEPRPRNPLLADIMKRIGLAERTGRGIDLIYQGLLRYGRPGPDYSRSDAHNVVLRLPQANADLSFLQLILDEEKRLGSPTPVDRLIALSELHRTKRLTVSTLSHALQKEEGAARALLERLVDAGLVEGRGSHRQRDYTLSAAVYRKLGRPGEYVRQAGFDPIQQGQMTLQYAHKYGRITRKEAAELCRLSPDQASRLLRGLVEQKRLTLHGERRSAYYTAS